MRVTLLRTSPGTAPGLLSRDAWRALETADRVLCDDPRTVVALAEQGIGAQVTVDVEADLQPPGDTGHLVLMSSEPVEVPHGVDVTSLVAAYDPPGAAVVELVAVMDRLRTDCPWDREQTHRSLARYLLEETYEALEAIDSCDRDHLREELGDLLLQVCFHARIASEADAGFDVDDVARGISEKLVYRHPHVFAGLEVADAEEVDRNWEVLKAAEKRRSSPLDGVPTGLPALAYADKVLGRLIRSQVSGDLVAELADTADGVGGRLLRLVVQARAAGLDPEQELRDAVRRVIERVALG